MAQLSGINDLDRETNASARIGLRAAQRGTQHLKCASLLLEKAIEKRRKAGGRVVAGGTDDRQRLLAVPVAQPKESGQIGYVVGMKMGYGDPG